MALDSDLIRDTEVDEQVGLLCRTRAVGERQGKLLEFLIGAKRSDTLSILGGTELLVKFEEENRNQGKPFELEKDLDGAKERARGLAHQLNAKLRAHYDNPQRDTSDKLRIVLPKDPEEFQKANHHYEPLISRLSSKSEAEDVRFWLVGDSLKALQHVTTRIPQLNRIEETFVRWIPLDSSLYTGTEFKEFLDALRTSKLLYRAVLGPLTDSVIYESGGLRDVLASRASEDPNGDRSAKLYRLLHTGALMNFTLLYYSEFSKSKSKFYHRTEKIEVLFGFGVHDPFERPDETVVYGSTHLGIVKEFQKLFKALRDKKFSRQLELDRPDLFLNEPLQCDVLATFSQLPQMEILRKANASGTGGSWSNRQSWEPSRKSERTDKYVPGRPQIKVCVSALRLLDDALFIEALQKALERGVQISIAIWTPGPFITARTKAAGLKAGAARRELKGARAALRELGRHPNLFIRECFGSWASASIIWIDELIYFSPYWMGRNVSEGPHFLVQADSATGKVLQDQYERMIATAKLV